MTSGTHAVAPVGQGEWLQTRPGERPRAVVSHPGDSTPLHSHNEDEHCLALEGAARIVRGDGTFDAPAGTAVTLPAVAIAGLFSHNRQPEGTAGKSFDCSRRGASVAEGHFETADHLQQGITVRPVGRPIAGSSLVRRLVLAKDDPAKQRIRAWLSNIDDERLFSLGFTSEDIAALRGTASPPAAGKAQALPMPTAAS
jgi:hypothetical protein